jgi:sec-independent protein translocase protein TatA
LFGGLRAQELLIVLLIVLLVFGARKLPDLARSLGASAKEFRKGIAEGSEKESDVQALDTQNLDSSEPKSP